MAASTKTSGGFTEFEIRRGERLFYGLVPFESGTFQCVSCHYNRIPDTMNWNPSAFDLAMAWKEPDGTNIYETMNNPLTPKLMADHKGMSITREEEKMLQAFFSRLAEKGPEPLQPYPIRTFTFWILGALMAFALIDLFITRKIKYRIIHVAILVIGLSIHGSYAVTEAINLGRTPGYAPDQPIKFSHKIHAGDNGTDCRYCHHIVDNSTSAGFPSLNVCLNCHNVVRNGTNSGRFEINKIHRAVRNNAPVQWIRVHKLPDHSFFSHSQHVNAGKIDCEKCHGPVKEMHIIRQVEDLSMGWCLNCHRETAVKFLENDYYKHYHKFHKTLLDGSIDSVTAAQTGGTNCMMCHY